MGKPDVWEDEDDGWTIRTEDGKPSAQWEYTILVTEDGTEILSHQSVFQIRSKRQTKAENKIIYICGFSHGVLNTRSCARIQHLLRDHKYRVLVLVAGVCRFTELNSHLTSSVYISYTSLCLLSFNNVSLSAIVVNPYTFIPFFLMQDTISFNSLVV